VDEDIKKYNIIMQFDTPFQFLEEHSLTHIYRQASLGTHEHAIWEYEIVHNVMCTFTRMSE